MSLYWYACISMNTDCYIIYHISLEIIWWVLSNASLIVQICPVVHEILANKDFTVTDDLISQLFVVAFVYPTYVQIALIWGFTVQLSLWKSVHWLWRYKLNEVCDTLNFFSSFLLFLVPVQIYCLLIPLFNTSGIKFCLHQFYSYYTIYFSLKSLHQKSFFILTFSCCSSKLLHKFLYYPAFLFHFLQLSYLHSLITSSTKFFFRSSKNLSTMTYNNTYWIYSSTAIFLILISIYNLYAIRNPETFSASPLNVCGLATSTFDSVLGWRIPTVVALPAPAANSTWSYICITTSCFYCC